MNQVIQLGRWGGLKWMMRGTAVAGTLLLWVVFSIIGGTVYQLPIGTALLGGLLAMLLHWFGEFWHQFGHAWAARRTGYPMSGVSAFWVLSASLYPENEPELPGRLHIQRALGGPLASILMTLIAALLVWGTRDASGLFYLLPRYFFWSNLLLFTLGALLPLGFTDGSTILKYWGKS